MARLATLLRIAETRTEDLRVALAEALRAQQDAAAALHRHEASMAAANSGRGEDGESFGDWAAWQAVAHRERRALHAAMAEQARQEAACRERIRDSVADAKRLELAIAAEARALRRHAERRREAAAEEAALHRHAPAG